MSRVPTAGRLGAALGLAGLLALLARPAAAQTYTGTLERGDDTLETGEFVDRYEIRVQPGATVRAVLTSDAFDPYVIVAMPGGAQEENDDCTSGDLARACVEVAADAAGVYRVFVTSFEPGETGPYRLVVEGGVGAAGGRGEGTGGWGRPSVASGRDERGGRDDRTRTAEVRSQMGGGRAGDRSGRQTPAARVAGPLAGTERVAGALDASDATIRSGEYVDAYEVRAEAGQTLAVELASDAFDTYVIVTTPSGDQEENDDCTDGDLRRSCVRVAAGESGTYRLLVTSFRAGETGAYTLTASTDGAAGAPVHPVRGDGARPAASGRVERGALATGDGTLQTGEYADRIAFTGTGGPVVVDLRAEGFDPYLIVTLPGGEQLDNDDYEGALDRALVVVDTEPGAAYTAVVTSYRPGETGRYTLAFEGDGADDRAPTRASDGVRQEQGQLARGDETLRSGEFVDTYTFQGVPGQRVAIDLTSEAFDTYLVVDPPRGTPSEDDDGGGSVGHSRIALDLTEAGLYTVHVTSYRAGETGPYTLAMDLSERFGRPAEDAPAPGDPGRRTVRDTPEGDGAANAPPARPSAPSAAGPSASYRPPTRRVADYTLAETVAGELDAQDERLSSGESTEVHTFDGDAGEPVRIEMTSESFDTYLLVTSPSGAQVENDDFEGAQNRSVIEFVMPESGRYRVTATSYRAGESGPYTLRISQADALAPEPAAFDRIVGVFAGVSDYERPGLPDLQWTAQDAVVARNAMIEAGMAPEDGILLTDSDATVGAVEDAFRSLAGRTDERTMFVFFFSGHGGQYPTAGAQRADPDGQDESIELFDGEILDDRFDAMLSQLPAGRQLVVLDACFSGGFSKDIITRPGRMGMFSSEEDVVSAVAVKFEAGGYLSHFFADAVAGHGADADGNGAVTPLELSQYIHDRYTSDVRGTGRELIVARDTRPEHQRFVVDRGSLGLYDTLFFLP